MLSIIHSRDDLLIFFFFCVFCSGFGKLWEAYIYTQGASNTGFIDFKVFGVGRFLPQQVSFPEFSRTCRCLFGQGHGLHI